MCTLCWSLTPNSTEFRPKYNNNGLVELNEPIPFRLTRNLHKLITNFSIEGPFANALTAAAQSLVERMSILENQLSLFFRDDLLSWHVSKTQPRPESEMQRIEQQLKERVAENVKRVVDRVNSIAPKPVGTSSSFRYQKAYELIEVATDPRTISKMGPTWFPWL